MGQSKICWAASVMDQTMVPRVRLIAASAIGLADRVSSLASSWLKIQGMGQSKICWAASFDGPNDGLAVKVGRSERDGSCRSGFWETEKIGAASTTGKRAEAGGEALN